MKKRSFTKLLSCLLAFVLTVTSVLPGFPSVSVKAAGLAYTQVKAGEQNGNSHDYENADAESKPAAVLLNQSTTMPLNGSVSAKVRFTNENPKKDARFAMFYTYKSATEWIYVGYDESSGWYYQYQNGDTGDSGSLAFSPSAPEPEVGKEYNITIALANEALQVKITEGTNEYTSAGSVSVLYTLAQSINGAGKIGFRAGNADSTATEFIFRDVTVGQTAAADSWAFLLPTLGATTSSYEISTYTVNGTVTDENDQAVEGANVRLAGQSAVTDEQGQYTFDGIEAGTYTLGVSAAEYEAASQDITVTDQNLTVPAIKLSAKQASTYDTYIESAEMKAAIDKSFPRVMQYEMKTGDAAGKIFHGQTNEINSVKINGINITPSLTNFDKKDDAAVYSLHLENEAGKIDLDMEVTISVSENDLTWEVTKITKAAECVKINTIEVPNLNLVTIDDSQENAQFMGAVNSGDVSSSGDREITFSSGFVANNTGTYGYGFVSGNGLSAGLWSNSEAAGDRRVTRNNGTNTMSLTSTAWYYEYGDSASFANYDGTPVSDLPCAKVCIAPDLNGDSVVNWQDGAIAYRDIMNNPYGSEDVPELVNYRVVMNLGGEATNPFLMSADNIKKVYLATDGLGQAIMHKGFGNEGHDSANSEYGGIAEKLGGADEFRKLIEIAHQYNTQVGIHVNATEAYPEAQTFSDDLIQGPNARNWNWMDQAYFIDQAYDLGTGLRFKRMLQLYDQINGTSLYANKWPGVAGQGTAEEEVVADAATIASTVQTNIEDGTNMDFIYLDVWYEDSWATRKIAQQFNSLGWRFSTEFGTSGEYDSTWQHWATDAAYGGSTSKGNNSQVMRFIRNHQKDSYVLNYPTFGGAADNPLLGHMYMNGFEGWGSNDSFIDYIVNTYTENVPAKFLQHYLITNWVNYSGVGADVSPVGNQEKQITLKSADGTDTVVVTRNKTQRRDSIIERTITLNGTKILDDAAYLLPWDDSETGEEKLYHWNYDGGETEWELLDDWQNLQTVMVYELSDQGRGTGVSVPVTDGKITLDAKEKTAYVVLKGQEAPKTLKKDFGEYARVTDPAFNNYAGTGDGTPLNDSVWSGDITDDSIRVKKASSGDQYLVIDSPTKDVAVSTQLHDLVPGQNYVAQIYVDNRSNVKASIEVNNGKETVSNYTLKSIAENYIRADLHNRTAVSGSRMQIMLVSFTAVSDTAVLTLRREAGEGYTHFDDIRIVAKSLYNYREDGTFVQDFESVVQGLYPFVMASGQGVDDPATHLSEYHAPYTQSGWGNVIIDDVISGQWSLKQHDSYFRRGLVYRTIPQNFRFEEGKTYEVSFDYQSGATDGFCMVIGDGEDENITDWLPYFENTTAGAGQKSWTNHFTFYITGAEGGQSWFGLYNFPENQGDSSYGTYDFILDNLVIREVEEAQPTMTLDKKAIVFAGVNGTETIIADVADDAQITYASANTDIATVDQNGTVTPVAFGETVISVMAKVGDSILVNTVDVTVARDGTTSFIKNAYVNQAQSGEGADKAIDGSEATKWHTPWSGFAVSESNPAILTLELTDNAQDLQTLRFQQRADSGSNGIIKKYQLVWGTTFNSQTHTVTGGGSGQVVTTSTTERQSGAWVDVDISSVDKSTVRYLQIRVLEGNTTDTNGPYASIAEIQAYKYSQFSGNEPSGNAVNKADLTAAIKELANMNTFGLSQEDIKRINAALETANATLTSANASAVDTAAQVDALNAIKTAMSIGKKTELQDAITLYKNLDTEKYTDDSVRIFQKALTSADLAAQKEGASSFEIQNALYVLEQAYADLVLKPDEQEDDRTLISAQQSLNKTLTSAASVFNAGQGNYTDDSWKIFIDAYNEANTGKDSQDAAVLTRLQKTLADAQAGLKEKAPNPPTGDGKNPPADDGKNPPADDGTNITKPTLTKGKEVTAATGTYQVTDVTAQEVILKKGVDNKSVTVPATINVDGITCKVVGIGNNAFKGAKKLTKVVIGDNVKTIGNTAFSASKKLKQVTIGKNVTTIGKKAFFNCKKLTKVTVKGTAIKKIGTNAFKGTNSKITVKLPKMKAKQKKTLKTLLKKAKISGKAKIK